MKHLLLGMVGLLLAGAACAGGVHSTRASVEASMVVTGTIGITAQGGVLAYTLDEPEKLPPVVVGVIGKDIPRWSFQPVMRDGKPIAAKTKMTLRLVAHPMGGNKFQIAVRGAYFGDQGLVAKTVKSVPPRYPQEAIRNRLDASVYLALRIDRAGNVTDAVAQQVNLCVIARENDMDRWRNQFAKASENAARQWTFTPAETVDQESYRVVRVPVVYRINDGSSPRTPAYGKWQSYVPGPLELVPWSEADKLLTGAPDALPGEGVYGRSELTLLTPLDRG